ncbi:MAG: 50S ribosomal protein L24 [Candidatus Nomurabacteria bacterium GW2011_GWF2_35_12]|uniref:Large ribosomal subunit protein uL24 n=3 Tax=Candidatus Nomuraibacteriota TaxID=1752729 RepID=A0A0G0DTF3_9BACT|nr:MAG: 50S ribosomal protein L24 [Candidatus Nomurabacteria bacterium GW2011_GWF2_35_12]KKP72617.1 MAG: 50S ribosomal protein L24 [Candidatus Nomurabacteria bacterium GW2011_GWB1_35_20]KKP76644.1 MAG: 50S ribosomal protein L24 [Parcubacteria group bacterium GW2011_GWC1_35_21]KKP78512.1 MAG: 50S ribosomal protein L24 [Candidatus Nomurabacteria bacterium GW2011_GWC2_35_35]KKP88597.1 MAG: 50S ribosomal protein L24 [Candidatus Nomurabacteria bacterium GW2011_GWA2_35_80]KKP97819.1 MAG: 50S ribosom
MKLRKNDNVIVITGKDKGKKGKIVTVLIAENKVIVEGINMMKKHQRPKKSGEKGTKIDIPMPIHASNVKKIN